MNKGSLCEEFLPPGCFCSLLPFQITIFAVFLSSENDFPMTQGFSIYRRALPNFLEQYVHFIFLPNCTMCSLMHASHI